MKKSIGVIEEHLIELALPIYRYQELDAGERAMKVYTKIDSDDQKYYQSCIYYDDNKISEFCFQIFDNPSEIRYINGQEISKEIYNVKLEELNKIVRKLNKDENI